MNQEQITPVEGLPALSLDALTSVAYGPEAIITVLATAGAGALRLILPHAYSLRDDRQVFAYGIWALAILSGILLVAVGGNTLTLIPLFAIGVFTGFTLSQAGLVVHWWRTRPTRWRRRAVTNGLGVVVTASATIAFLVTKFTAGAWVVVLAIPLLMVLFARVHRFYDRARRALQLTGLVMRPAPLGLATAWQADGERVLASRTVAGLLEIRYPNDAPPAIARFERSCGADRLIGVAQSGRVADGRACWSAVRFVFTPPVEETTGLLTLPWTEPLEDWRDERLVEIRQRGLSRHVVRFVADNGALYALKSISERLARREYRLLRFLAQLGVPAVEVVGVAVDLGPDADAVLVTRFLTFATTYRAVFSSPRGGPPTGKLLDALVELLARLHLSGFFWGDCSLSNTLFRYDAGTLEAYLVDAETSEQHPELSRGQREYDVELAVERVYAELLDLQAGDLLPENIDPLEVAEDLQHRYERLWDELTREETIPLDEQRFRIAERLRRLNELGFAAEEVELISTPRGDRLRVRTRVAESGDHSRKLFLRTGLDVGENQARRLLNDIASFRAYLEQKERHPVPEIVAANRWLTEVYDPVASAIPDDLQGRLAPAEVFHEVLEHRWYMSERAGRDVGTTAAARSYFERVLPHAPESLDAGTDSD